MAAQCRRDDQVMSEEMSNSVISSGAAEPGAPDGRVTRTYRGHEATGDAGGPCCPLKPQVRPPMVLSLCDRTGNMVRPWAAAGYDCVCVDVAHSIRRDAERDGIRYVWGDVRCWWPETLDGVAAVFAFPPCTDLAVSGARDFQRKGLTRLIDALTLVEACRRICVAAEERGALWMIENPVGRLNTLWRPPDYQFDPADFAMYAPDPAAEAYTKRTCLWTGGGFVMPERRAVVPVLGSMMHTLPPSADRADRRSETPRGFAQAVFEANNLARRKAA